MILIHFIELALWLLRTLHKLITRERLSLCEYNASN